MNVFISWSGERSKAVAAALRDWIPAIIQRADPWMSDIDIDAGDRWSRVIEGELNASSLGIICLTPENLRAPWILFEAGALAKWLGERSRVCPYLFGLQPSDVPSTNPLWHFHAKVANRDRTFELVQSINGALPGEVVAAGVLTQVFTALWPSLEERLNSVPLPPVAVPQQRSIEEMIPEILDAVRALERKLSIQNEFTEGSPERSRGFELLLADTIRRHPSLANVEFTTLDLHATGRTLAIGYRTRSGLSDVVIVKSPGSFENMGRSSRLAFAITLVVPSLIKSIHERERLASPLNTLDDDQAPSPQPAAGESVD